MTVTSGRRRLTRKWRSGSCATRCPSPGRGASSRRTGSVEGSWTDRNFTALNGGKGNTRNTRAAVRRAPRHPPPPRVPPCPAAPTPRPPAPQPPTGTPTMATGARGTLWPRDVSVDQSEDGLLCAGSSGI